MGNLSAAGSTGGGFDLSIAQQSQIRRSGRSRLFVSARAASTTPPLANYSRSVGFLVIGVFFWGG